jgi:hypothetical protein
MKVEKQTKQRAANLVRSVLESEYVLFFQTIFADGTLDKDWTADMLLEALKARADFPEGALTFLVTQQDSLNELAPVEVLAGRRFRVQNQDLHSSLRRVLDHKLHERVIRVIYAARDHFHPAY